MPQLALGWLLAQQNSKGEKTLVPIPGTKHINYMHENGLAADIELDQNTVIELNDLINEDTIRGDRYSEQLMQSIDSENDRKKEIDE